MIKNWTGGGKSLLREQSNNWVLLFCKHIRILFVGNKKQNGCVSAWLLENGIYMAGQPTTTNPFRLLYIPDHHLINIVASVRRNVLRACLFFPTEKTRFHCARDRLKRDKPTWLQYDPELKMTPANPES